MKRSLLIVGAGLALVACASAQLDTGKSLIVAADALTAAAQQADVAYKAGALTKAQVTTADGYADTARTAVMTAQCAYANGDLSTTASAIAEVTALGLAIIATVKNTPLPTIAPVAALTCTAPAAVSDVVVP
jgi:D-serine deaminase-like pyridoxal phosphate-dependent protein